MINYPKDLVSGLDQLRAYDDEGRKRLKSGVHWRHFDDIYLPWPAKFLDQIDCGMDGHFFIKNGTKELVSFFQENRPKNEAHILILEPFAKEVLPQTWAENVRFFKILDERAPAEKELILTDEGPGLRDKKSLHEYNIKLEYDHEVIGFSALKMMAIYKLGRYSDFNPQVDKEIQRIRLSPYHYLIITE